MGYVKLTQQEERYVLSCCKFGKPVIDIDCIVQPSHGKMFIVLLCDGTYRFIVGEENDKK